MEASPYSLDMIIFIDKKRIGYNQQPFIIAEAGVNHNGKLDLALKLVDAAKKVGADAIKFQTFKAEQVVISKGKMAEYQKKNTGKKETQLKMLKKLELREEDFKKIISHCKKKNIIFLSTPHGGFESVDFLQSLKVPAFKFGSGDLTNLPVLEHAAKFKKPMILGAGMATMKEVKEAVDCIKKAGNKKIILLHCTTDYPCLSEEVNLASMQSMMKKFPDLIIGYSDHTLGEQVPVMAVTLGAHVIEKHFTLDKKMKGPDHKASAEPQELKEIIEKIRNVETILGSSIKKPTASEKKYILIVRKSVISLTNIKKGGKFTKDNIGIKRPGNGLPPRILFNLLGKKAKRNIRADSLVRKADVV